LRFVPKANYCHSMPGRLRILIVEDEAPVRNVLTRCLELAGFSVSQATDGEMGLAMALRENPDLLILDVDLPQLDGMTVCVRLRERSFVTPILMLTGKSKVEDRVAGLNAGADDYLGKPFAADEFLARVNALLRRHHRTGKARTILQIGNARIDLEERTATRSARPLMLTKTEYALLAVLAANVGKPVSRETILSEVWGYTRLPATRTVDTHIWRLRKKIGDEGESPRWIKQVHGRGYCLSLPGDVSL
jgi:DNA-binding response OmpR family regulator